jgi:hypothetical protein
LESVEFEDWGASRICGKLDVDQRTFIYGADPVALNEILKTIRRGLEIVDEALFQRKTSLVCDWARSGNATLRFACGCSLRLEAVPGEFEEHMAYYGYEGCEFDEEEDKEAAFESLAPAEFLLCDVHRPTFENIPDDELFDLQLDYVERYYDLASANILRSALYFRRADLGDEKNELVALKFNFHNLAEFLAAKKREGWTGYDTLVGEMRHVFPDFRGIEIVKTKYGEEVVVGFNGAESVDLCGMRPSELAFLAFLASVIDMRRTPLRKTNYLFYADVERYLPPVAYDSFFRILNHTQQNVVATSSNPEFIAAVHKSKFSGSVACNVVFCTVRLKADDRTTLVQRKYCDVVRGDVLNDLVEVGRKFVKLDAKRDS